MPVQQSKERVAAVEVIRTHQRRHPAEPGCCCSWRPDRPGVSWSDHVLEQLDLAGVLPPLELRPVEASGPAPAMPRQAHRPLVPVALVAAAALVASAVRALRERG